MEGDLPEFLTPDEVSARYRNKISVRTLANWRYLGTGPKFTRSGGRILYPRSDLMEWEAKRTVNSTGAYSK